MVRRYTDEQLFAFVAIHVSTIESSEAPKGRTRVSVSYYTREDDLRSIARTAATEAAAFRACVIGAMRTTKEVLDGA